MKKFVMRVCASFLALILVLSVFSVPAFAAASQVFFTKNVPGYACTGRGSITGNTAVAILSVTEGPIAPVLPSDACTCEAWVTVYDSSDEYVGSEHIYGNTYAKATVLSPRYISWINCGFTFNGEPLDVCRLDNN